MLTIDITKCELKKAFFGGSAEFYQEVTADGEPETDLNIVLLKIMLENYKTKESA